MEEHALTDAAGALFGLRRFGADLGLIQMLQYYATPAGAGPSRARDGDDPHDHQMPSMSSGEGKADQNTHVRIGAYGEMSSYALRVLSLDPYFHYAILFGAGALAFNLNRDDEATALLTKAAAIDPTFWQYRLYAGAIAFRRNNEIDKIIPLLEEALKYPDCPSMIHNILGNIYVKLGDIPRAVAVYTHLAETSRDPAYRHTAQEKLERLRGRGVMR